jgi:hypothetical protein
MVATIVKKYLLDTEFYGETCDVEFIDLGVPLRSKERVPQRYSLADLPLWSDERLTDRLTVLAEALERLQGSDRIIRRHRVGVRPEPDMPLFD